MEAIKEIEETKIIGDISIPAEIQRLENTEINISNYHSVLDKFRTLLTNIDTVFKEKMETHAKVMDEVNSVMDSDEVTENMEVLRQNIWYTKVVTPMMTAMAEIYRAVGYSNQIVAIQKIIVRKEKELLDTHQEMFSNQMRQEGIAVAYENMRKSSDSAVEKMVTMMTNTFTESRKADSERLTSMLQAVMPFAGKRVQPPAQSSEKQDQELPKEDAQPPEDTGEEPSTNIKVEESILKFLSKNPKAHNMTVRNRISKGLGVEVDEVKNSLNKLHKEGKIKKLGVGIPVNWSLV